MKSTKLKFTKTDYQIRNELYRSFALLGQKSDLLSVIGSWKDTLSDDDIFKILKEHNKQLSAELKDRLNCANNF